MTVKSFDILTNSNDLRRKPACSLHSNHKQKNRFQESQTSHQTRSWLQLSNSSFHYIITPEICAVRVSLKFTIPNNCQLWGEFSFLFKIKNIIREDPKKNGNLPHSQKDAKWVWQETPLNCGGQSASFSGTPMNRFLVTFFEIDLSPFPSKIPLIFLPKTRKTDVRIGR